MNIYVSNLSFNVQNEDLRDFFTPYGEVTSAKIIFDGATGRSRGFGFVEMPSDEDAEKAIAGLNLASVQGRNINVVQAKPRESRPPRAENGDSYGSRDGGYKKSW